MKLVKMEAKQAVQDSDTNLLYACELEFWLAELPVWTTVLLDVIVDASSPS